MVRRDVFYYLYLMIIFLLQISHYEEKEPEAANFHKKVSQLRFLNQETNVVIQRMEAAAEELRKIIQTNTEATLVLEEQQAVRFAR